MTLPPLSHLALSDNGFLFDSATGDTFTLNSTGTLIMKGIINGSPKEQIIDEVAAEYEIGEDAASLDFDRFVHFCIEQGLVEGGRY